MTGMSAVARGVSTENGRTRGQAMIILSRLNSPRQVDFEEIARRNGGDQNPK